MERSRLSGDRAAAAASSSRRRCVLPSGRRTFVYPRFVRRAVCPHCGTVKPPNLVGEFHTHSNRKSATFVARMVRVPLYPVEQRDVDGALAWLDEHWRGEPYVPDELLPLVAVA